MSYIIKTAAITQKGVNAEFNSDNLNLNGKVLTIENANNGFKGAGSMKAPFAVAFASALYNGFAGAALTALNDRIPMLKEDEDRFASVLEGYFADSRHALEQCQCDVKGLSVAVLVGYENKFVAARMGNGCILRYSAGDLEKVGYVAQGENEEKPHCSCEVINEIVDGDLFVLCSEAVLSAVTEGEIIVALNAADGNEKKAVQMLAAKYAKRAPEANVSFTVVRIIKQEEAAAPVVTAFTPAANTYAPATPVEIPVAAEETAQDNVYEPEHEEYDEYAEYEEEPEMDPRKKIILWSVLCVASVLVMIITGFVAYKIAYSRNHSDVEAGLVMAGSDAQYDMNVDLTTEAAATEAATTEAATEEASEKATEEATEESTTSSSSDDDDDYYEDDDDYDDDYDYDYDYEEEDTNTVETVPRPTEAPTQAPTEAPEEEPGEEEPGEEEEENGGLVEAPEDETFDPAN